MRHQAGAVSLNAAPDGPSEATTCRRRDQSDEDASPPEAGGDDGVLGVVPPSEPVPELVEPVGLSGDDELDFASLPFDRESVR